jgi:type I restriction enzyme S subunit
VLASPFIRQLIEGPIRTTSGVKNINSTEISQLLIPLCSLEEQKAIVSKVNALMGLCDSLEKEIEQNTQQVEDLMQSCLREVFERGNFEEGQELLGMAAEPKEEYGKNS